MGGDVLPRFKADIHHKALIPLEEFASHKRSGEGKHVKDRGGIERGGEHGTG
jgi:hypothetical protein